MNKIIISISAAILICSAAVAQNFSQHEFSINIGGGAAGFQSRPTIGKDYWKGAFTTGLDYRFLLNKNWGVSTGINFAFYNGSISIKNYDQQQVAINTLTGHTFDFLVTSSAYKEKQKVTTLTIPLLAQYQYQSDEKMAYYAAIGFKVGIPVSAKSQSKGIFTTKGYYPNLEVTYEDFPDYGFVTNQSFPENKTNLKLKTAIMAAAEFGVIWRMDKTTRLYTGIYTDYGLNNMLDKKNAANNLVTYQSNLPAQFVYNAAANAYAKKMKPLAIGITLRYAFQLETLRSIF